MLCESYIFFCRNLLQILIDCTFIVVVVVFQALGCLLFEMCALRHAFEAANLVSLSYKIMKMEYGVSEQYKGGNTNINN